jgi:type I restriction enzyme S subunit
MSKAKSIVPELRFPEFEEYGEWKIRSVKQNIDLISGIALKSKELTEDNSGTPILRGINITEGQIRHSAEMDRFYLGDTSKMDKFLIHENDIVIGMDGSKVGKNVALVSEKDAGAILIQRVARIQAINSDVKYLYHNFFSNAFRRYVDSVNTSSGIPHISSKQIRDFEIGFPPTIQEQQKIADCLSSLDALIAAHRDKLDALREHKKGLMQNLFPQEGETVPRYRFAGFEGAWEEKELGDAADFINGRAYKKDELLKEGKYRVLRVGNFFTNKEWFYSDLELNEDKYCEKGDLLYAWSASFGPYLWEEEKVIYHYHIWKVINKPKVDKLFLYYLLDFETFRMKSESLNGFALKHLTKGAIEKWQSYIPIDKKEQQKIADCLSEVDMLITAQLDKIDALEEHKRGLMQGLFPKTNG